MTYRHHRHCRHHGDDSGMGCLVMLLLGLAIMPFVGIYWAVAGDTEDKRAIGVGIIIFVSLLGYFHCFHKKEEMQYG